MMFLGLYGYYKPTMPKHSDFLIAGNEEAMI